MNLSNNAAVQIRDSKQRRRVDYDPNVEPTIKAPLHEIELLVQEAGLGNQQFSAGTIRVVPIDGIIEVSSTETDISLRFSEAEWKAFGQGAADGEFSIPTR